MKIVTSDEIRAIAGVDTRKCMRCGKCSASCPAYNEMDIRPHQFVSYVQNGDVEALMNSKSPDEVPALLDDETPQQLLMSAFRKYRK